MTKILVQRLIPVLPTILTTAQLCSVRGRSIFDGIMAIASVIEAVKRARRPAWLLNLDFFHAYDRVCLPYVDRVLVAMGFGGRFRRWVQALHRGASASFLLHRITPAMDIIFSLRQGDPLAMLLFIIQLEPFLWQLNQLLPGVHVGHVLEAALAYVDDVDVLGEGEDDLVMVDELCPRLKAMSGAILNRNRKSAILGLGTWSGRQKWPLGWLQAPLTLRVFGVTFGPSLGQTVNNSWQDALERFKAAMAPWSRRALPTLRLRRDMLEVFLFSKLWYLAQALPMPPAVAHQFTAAAAGFLWPGFGFGPERVAMDTLHAPLEAGGLGLTHVASRAQALLAKQLCWQIAEGGPPLGYLAHWLGPRLADMLPQLRRPPLPLQSRLRRLGEADGDCRRCPGVEEDAKHFFTGCPRVADVWQPLYRRLAVFFLVPPPDRELLLLLFEEVPVDNDVASAIIAYMAFAWANRHQVLVWADFVANMRGRPYPTIINW